MKEMKMGVYTKGEETFNFNFYTTLSMSEKVTFVNSIVNTIVDDDYNSIIRPMIFDFMIVKMMTDVDTSFANNSNDTIDAIEQFLTETNIVDIVKINMEESLLDELNVAIDKAIEYRTGIHPSPIADSLASLLSTLERKVNELNLDDMMNMAQKFAGMTGELTPESIVNAYINSDIHKKNEIEIEEAKRQRAEFTEDMDKAIKIVKEEK